MIITQAVLDGLRTTFGLQFFAAYEGTPIWSDKLASEIPSTSKSNTYGWMASSVAMREWIGPRVSQNLQEHSYVLLNKKYEASVDLKRDDIADDDLGVFSTMTIPALAEAARKHPDTLLASLLSANPTAFDAKAFFATDHPNYNRSGVGATTYSNDLAPSSSGGALDGNVVASTYATMAAYIGENGLPLSVRPSILMVPPQREREALVVMQSTTYALPVTQATTAATVDNPLRGWAEVVVVPELAGSPNVVYFADCRKAIRPFVHQIREALELTSRVNLEDPKVFDLDVFTYGVRVRRNMGVTLPHLCARVTIS